VKNLLSQAFVGSVAFLCAIVCQSAVLAEPSIPDAFNITDDSRVTGLTRSGSETGTSQPPTVSSTPYAGLVVRRINSSITTAGQILARTPKLRLERDGTVGGLQLAYDASNQIRNLICTGVNSSGATVNRVFTVPNEGSGVISVYTDSQQVIYANCSFGNTFGLGSLTQVFLQRYPNDFYWVGTVISNYNQ